MIIIQAGITYDIVNPIITIKGITFDLKKANDMSLPLTEESELSRLYLEILGHSSFQRDTIERTVTILALKGINPVTATFSQMRDYLDDDTIKTSESRKELVRRIMSIKFPADFRNEVNHVSKSLKREYELIDSHTNKDVKFLGEVGFFNKVRLDGSLNTLPKTAKFV